jgi:hypothetical protein
LWQKTQLLRTGLPKPIGEVIPAASLMRKVLSRKTVAPRTTEARNSRTSGDQDAFSRADALPQASNSLQTGVP